MVPAESLRVGLHPLVARSAELPDCTEVAEVDCETTPVVREAWGAGETAAGSLDGDLVRERPVAADDEEVRADVCQVGRVERVQGCRRITTQERALREAEPAQRVGRNSTVRPAGGHRDRGSLPA